MTYKFFFAQLQYRVEFDKFEEFSSNTVLQEWITYNHVLEETVYSVEAFLIFYPTVDKLRRIVNFSVKKFTMKNHKLLGFGQIVAKYLHFLWEKREIFRVLLLSSRSKFFTLLFISLSAHHIGIVQLIVAIDQF